LKSEFMKGIQIMLLTFPNKKNMVLLKFILHRYVVSRRYSIFTATVLISVFISFSIANSAERKLKKETKPVSRPCCVLGLASYVGKSSVVLEQICKTGSTMSIYFHTKDMAGTCVHPPSTILTDQNGNRYSMIFSKGLPECSKGKLNEKPDIQFNWVFKSFGPDVKKFTLKEVEDTVTLGMLFWIWQDVDVSHCKF